MKGNILLSSCIVLTQFVAGQTSQALYKRADSLYKLKDFRNSAIAYSDGIRAQGNSADISRYRTAIGYWAKADIRDSAFYMLSTIAKSGKLSKIDVQQLEYGAQFASLRTDKRWENVLSDIRQKKLKKTAILRMNLFTAGRMGWRLHWYRCGRRLNLITEA